MTRRTLLPIIALLLVALPLVGCAAKPRQVVDVKVDGAAGVRWALGDSRVVVQLLGRGVAVYDETTGEETAAWRRPGIPSHASYGLAVSAAGETLAVATEDSVRVFRTADAAPLLVVPGGGRALALSGDGARVAWSDGAYGRVLKVADGRVIAEHLMPADRGGVVWLERVGRFAWTDTRRVVFMGPDSTVAGELTDFDVPEVGPLATSGSGATLVVGEGPTALSVWDTKSKKRRWRAQVRGRDLYSRMAMSADTWYLATVNGGEVTLRWAYTSTVVTRWKPHGGAEVRDLAFATSGHLLATVGADGHMRVWDIPTPKQEQR